MRALDCLHTRNSVALLQGPGPDADAVAQILNAAVRANDHRRLRPWRFIVVQGDARHRLGQIFSAVYAADNPDHSPQELEQVASKALRAPLIIIVVARIEEDAKVPRVEQLLSAGGASQLMTVAAHALGYGSIWRTGAMAYHPEVRRRLGLSEGELLIGFVYIGTPKSIKPLANIDYRNFAEFMDS